MEPKERHRAVLAAVIEEYIRSGEPVGSKALVSLLGNTVSSATIRNDMADLAADGYLEQPHTSAGRVPTAKAYRLYVDRLMRRDPLSAEKRQEIEQLVGMMSAAPEKLTENAAQALAYFTGCAAVTTSPERQGVRIHRIELMRVHPQAAVLILMTDDGRIQNRLCRFEAEVSDPALAHVSALLNAAFAEQLLDQVDLPQIQSLLNDLGGDALLCMPALTAFHELIREGRRADVALGGQMNLLQYPDFEKQRAQQLMHFLSQRQKLAEVLSAQPEAVQVLLGSESRLPELDGSSMIITRYRADEQHGGYIAVVGPQRMNYAATIPQIEYFASLVGRVLADWIQ